MGEIFLVTGEHQIGKTTLCLHLVDALRAAQVKVTGVITLRTGLHDLAVNDLVYGETYPLTLPFSSEGGVRLPYFIMNPESLSRGARTLEQSFPTQVFVLDEIGPLELKRGEGWVQGLSLLQTSTYQVALVIIRPELLYDLITRLSISVYTVVYVSEANREVLPALLYDRIVTTLREE
ncbi:MAG: hypothetical protein JXA33_28830 [Anaerolineae bacterium]|nr:hypothetical protein [Anaerolineae bacterium]